MGSHLTWPHGPPVSKAFFGPFLCAKVFLDPFCVVGRSKKNLGSGGAGVPSFKDLSGIVPFDHIAFWILSGFRVLRSSCVSGLGFVFGSCRG